jgi:DNA adenine methylase
MAVKRNPGLVWSYLKSHSHKTCEEYYYQVREENNNSKPSYKRAASFIYLNKTCFNGIWRVNKLGKFNVPYGFKEPPSLPSEHDLILASNALANTILDRKDYREAVEEMRNGDFVYFDPPYPPINGTSCFTHYTRERFTKQDHIQLANVAMELDRRGCYVLISNTDTEYVRSLYADKFNIFELEVTRWISSKGERYKVKELVIRNY